MAAMSTTSSATHAEAMQTLDHVYYRRPDGYLGIVPMLQHPTVRQLLSYLSRRIELNAVIVARLTAANVCLPGLHRLLPSRPHDG